MATPTTTSRPHNISGARRVSFNDSVTVALECQARGLEASTAEDQKKVLTLKYVAELKRLLEERGFRPISDDLEELEAQRRVVELLLLWAAGADAPDGETAGNKENRSVNLKSFDVLDPRTLQRAQLAKKQLEGCVDDGYAFGRRFLSIATYVETLDSEELLAVAQKREMKLPKLDVKERAMVKALDRELLGQHGTADGTPLRSLTLRQLVTEAEARGLMRAGAEKARDSKGKKSKRAWVDMLRPVMRVEVRAVKIFEKEEELLREQLAQELEQDMQHEQNQRITQLIQLALEQLQGNAEPENDPTSSQETQQGTTKALQNADKARKYLEALAKTLCVPSETAEDIVMTE
ncbi:hypothetical protein JM18_003060 [Phytophthora kernoviae]|uniref:Uncharacterized protein n=1 Tax=Phytophthora kernoviae TaxID=325452 RepID=A0A8T0M3Z4_9STRA|nr:hypothetical protein JM16_002378 [Phytophthora kernoviae]KAG2528492.1 hypothetical protein JM18_003060 [Phytophthora kernoviae]